MRARPFVLATAIVTAAAAVGAQQPAQVKPPAAPMTRDQITGKPPAPAGNAVIAGTLTAADTGRPVRRARVSLVSAGAGFSKSATTDDQGRFTLTDLPAGEFTLSASRPGFLDVSYGQRQPGSGRPGTPLRLDAGQKIDRVTLRIPRGGVITGQVVDEQGEASFGTQVRALRYVMRSGERTLQSAGNGTTDDRGIYRIPALLPGDYIVTATPREVSLGLASAELEARAESIKAGVAAAASEVARAEMTEVMSRLNAIKPTGVEELTGYAPVYHPNTTRPAAAATITLGVSEERPNVDLQLQVVPMAKISGMVIGPEGGVPAGTNLQLIDSGQPVPGFSSRGARVTPDGQFSFTQVPPGRYLVVARATPRVTRVEEPIVQWAPGSPQILEAKFAAAMSSSGNALWAMTETTVDGRDVPNLVLSLQRGMTVAGAFVFDGAPPPGFDPTKVRVTMTPLSPNMGEMQVPVASGDQNAHFTLRGVVPGRYRLNVSGAAGGYVLRSAQFGAVDVLDAMVDVKPGEDLANGILTFAAKLGDVGGSVRDASNAPVGDYTIIVFSAEPRFWTPQSRRIQAARPASDGSFNFRNLPEGDYRIVAVVDPEPGQWFDAKYLEALVGGSIVVKLAEGQRTTQGIRIARLPD